jgi:hypothetical protein
MVTPTLEQIVEALRTLEALASTYDGDPERVVIARDKSYGPGLFGLHVPVRLVDLQRAGQAADLLDTGELPPPIEDEDLHGLLLAIERGEVGLRQAPAADEFGRFTGDTEYETSNGWRLTVFIDCGEWDYLNSVTSPHGARADVDAIDAAMPDSATYRPSRECAAAAWGVNEPGWKGWHLELFDTPKPAGDGWHRFADALPPVDVEILIHNEGSYYAVGRYYDDGPYQYDANTLKGAYFVLDGGPTLGPDDLIGAYWRPLPAQPKGES